MQLKSLEKEVWGKFSLDDEISFEQAKPAVRYIIARLRGDLERQFTDKKFRVLFREIDVNNNGKIERAELSLLVKRLASFDEHEDGEKNATLRIERLLKEVKHEFNFSDDQSLSMDQTRLAVSSIMRRLFGQDVNRYFTDHQFKALFAEFDFNQNASIDFFELFEIARRIAYYA